MLAREASALPCLRKEFLVDPWQVTESRALGADAILVILAMVDDTLASDLMEAAHEHGMDVLVEVHDEAEMARAAGLKANLVGVNNRDLRTFDVDLADHGTAGARRPGRRPGGHRERHLHAADAARLEPSGAKAMLVGESLMRQPDVAPATSVLAEARAKGAALPRRNRHRARVQFCTAPNRRIRLKFPFCVHCIAPAYN